jgi:hypothetical protein
MTRSSVF